MMNRKGQPMNGTKMGRMSRRSAGFTLLEMMLVVVIIGLLATVVVVNLAGSSDTAREGTTVASMNQIKLALTTHYAKHGSYPPSLAVLTTGSKPLLERLPQDAWKRDFVYMTPGTDVGRAFTLYSLGKDGQPNTEDDINVWTMDQME